jgi:hypothetical protein
MRRVLRQMAAQHRHLKPIYGMLVESIARGIAAEARSAFESYREAIEAHFSLEDEFFFPALHGLHPERGADLEGLVREHARFRQEVGAVGALLHAAQLERGAAALEALAAALGSHEEREEKLVASLHDRGVIER